MIKQVGVSVSSYSRLASFEHFPQTSVPPAILGIPLHHQMNSGLEKITLDPLIQLLTTNLVTSSELAPSSPVLYDVSVIAERGST